MSRIFIKAYRHRASQPAPDAAMRWVFRIARTTLIDYWRVEKRREAVSSPLEQIAEPPSGAESPEAAYERRQRSVEVLRLVGALHDEDRMLIALKFAGQRTNREIAAMMSISDGSGQHAAASSPAPPAQPASRDRVGMSEQRDRARRLSEFADGLLMPQRHDHRVAELPPEDREFHELRALAQELADIAIEPPAGFADQLRRRLPALAAERPLGVRLRRAWRQMQSSVVLMPPLSPILTALVVLVAVLLVRTALVVPVVSAAEILTRSNEALAQLVKPGQLLYRRWRVTSTTTTPSGERRTARVRTIREWMDGSDPDRVASRWVSDDDRLLIAYTSIAPDGEQRPNVYFSPGVFREARGLFSIEPTVDEFRQAMQQFPEPVRSQLDIYLGRQYIYLPIAGERLFNRSVLDSPRQGASPFARIVLSFDRATIDGTVVYRVRATDPASIDFNWRSDGPPRVRMARAETVRYIAQDSFLGVRTEETITFADGQRRFTTRELVETRAVPVADLSLDPFRLEIPEGTPVKRQSALDHLSGVAAAFGRLPNLSRSLARPSTTH